MPKKLDAVFQQRDDKNSKFVERVISGSNLFIKTDQQGVLVGSKKVDLSGSMISASGLFVDGTTNINPNGPTVLIKDVKSTTGSFDKIYLNPNGNVSAPISSNSYGTEGELRTDDNFLYLYLNGKWRRSPFNLFENSPDPTPSETPALTPSQTPIVTPSETPDVTPSVTPSVSTS